MKQGPYLGAVCSVPPWKCLRVLYSQDTHAGLVPPHLPNLKKDLDSSYIGRIHVLLGIHILPKILLKEYLQIELKYFRKHSFLYVWIHNYRKIFRELVKGHLN